MRNDNKENLKWKELSYVDIYSRMTNETAEDNPPQWASTMWFAVYVTECIMIFTINAVTLIAFARNRHLYASAIDTW